MSVSQKTGTSVPLGHTAPERFFVSLPAPDMDHKVVFAALDRVCEDNISALCGPSDSPYGSVTQRLVTCMKKIQEHGRALEPVVSSFTAVYHHYDLDAQTPGNGYRTLVKVRRAPSPLNLTVSKIFTVGLELKVWVVVTKF